MYFSPVLVGFMLKHKMRMRKRNTALQSYIGVEGLSLCCWNGFADTASQYRVLYIVLCDPVYASPAVAAVSIYALIKNLLLILAASET